MWEYRLFTYPDDVCKFLNELKLASTNPECIKIVYSGSLIVVLYYKI